MWFPHERHGRGSGNSWIWFLEHCFSSLVLLVFRASLTTCCARFWALEVVLGRISHYLDARSIMWHPQKYVGITSCPRGKITHTWELCSSTLAFKFGYTPEAPREFLEILTGVPPWEALIWPVWGGPWASDTVKAEIPSCRPVKEWILQSYQIPYWLNWTQHKIH